MAGFKNNFLAIFLQLKFNFAHGLLCALSINFLARFTVICEYFLVRRRASDGKIVLNYFCFLLNFLCVFCAKFMVSKTSIIIELLFRSYNFHSIRNKARRGV